MSPELTTVVAASNRAQNTSRPFSQSGRLAYIDGVRAIAIVAVVSFHAHIPGFRGGFIGVDVFFVISGFLITRQIVSQTLAGRFSATDFYARRILRIFPPLLLVTIATLAVATMFPLLPQERHDLAGSAIAAAAMASNYFFTSGTEYFSTPSDINPLLHTWSLGVEEQYYLFAPAFTGATIALAARRKWSPTRALLGFGAVAIVGSYIALVILTRTDHRLAFFSIMSRAWQFALGGMIAIAVVRSALVPQRFRSALGAAGLLAIAASVMLYTEHLSYPGYVAACVPTFGTLLLLASGIGNEKALLVRALSSRPAVAIGLLSYSWYLWHWPLVELARTLAIGQDSLWKDIAASAAAFLLSIPTYLFVERPLKTLRRPEITQPFGGRIVTAGVASSVFAVVFALMLARSTTFNRHLQAIEIGEPSETVIGCQRREDAPNFRHVEPCVVGGAADPSVVFWGDSHAKMLSPVAEWSARAADRTAIVVGKPACPPLLGIEIDYFRARTCADSNDELLAWVEKQHSHPVTGVVLAGRWAFYSEQDPLTEEADLPRMLWRDANRPRSGYADMLSGGLRDLLTTLSPSRRVLIVGLVPEFKHPVANCLLRAQLNGQSRESCALDRSEVERRRREAEGVLQRVVTKFPNARIIDPLDVFCDRDKCWPFGPRGVFFIDKDHLSALGAERLYQHFQRDIRWVYGDVPEVVSGREADPVVHHGSP